MINLYNYIVSQISTITPKVYPEKAPQDTKFPYVIFRFPASNPGASDREDVILEIDIWDSARSGYDVFTEIETLTTNIDNLLKVNRHLDNDLFLIFQKMNRLAIPDPEETVKRRQLRYLIKMYQR